MGIIEDQAKAKSREAFLLRSASFSEIPTLAVWKEKSSGKQPGLNQLAVDHLRKQDRMLAAIDEMVETLEHAGTGGQRVFVLGELFMTTLGWINSFRHDPNDKDVARRSAIENLNRDPTRRSAILSLNMCAAKKLCEPLNCTLGDVGRRLRDMYGEEMGEHGRTCDAGEGVHVSAYQTGARYRESFRIFFLGGKACSFMGTSKRPSPFDTPPEYIGDTDGQRYVMTVSGTLYVFPNITTIKYHSCITGGKPVMCAGYLRAARGNIVMINNKSGHYAPDDASLIKVVWRLRTHGADLRNLIIEQARSEEHVSASLFIAQNGNWTAMKRIGPMGTKTPGKRCTCPVCIGKTVVH